MTAARWPVYLGAALAGGALLYVLAKKQPGQSYAASVGMGAATAVGDAAAGAVVGIGSWFGIPETNLDQCSQDLAAGRTWDASFSCPAGRFIKGTLSGSASTQDSINDAALRDAERVDLEIQARQYREGGLTGVYVDDEKVSQYDEMGNRIF